MPWSWVGGCLKGVLTPPPSYKPALLVVVKKISWLGVLAGWSPPPPPHVGVGNFWVGGSPRNSGWVGLPINPPPPSPWLSTGLDRKPPPSWSSGGPTPSAHQRPYSLPASQADVRGVLGCPGPHPEAVYTAIAKVGIVEGHNFPGHFGGFSPSVTGAPRATRAARA